MKTKINKKKIWIFFLLFPYVCPRGFFEIYPIYKTVMTLWLAIMMAGMILLYVYKLSRKKALIDRRLLYVLFYFGIMIIETLIIKKRLGEGLQKMFATPALFMFMISFFDKYSDVIIDVLSDISLFNLLLFCTVFNPIIFQRLYGMPEQICFLGHIQICTEMALLCMALAIIVINKSRVKALLMIFFSLLTMLLSNTSAGIIIFVFLSIMYVIYKFGIKKNIAILSQKKIFIIGTAFEGLMLLIITYFRIDFGARYFVYIEGLSKLQGHIVAGYGVNGVLIKTFWHEWVNSAGMNYAHNQVLQLLLDGGVILLLSYMVMGFGLLRNKKLGGSICESYWYNTVLIAFLAVGVCESLTEYNYFYLFLIINSFLPSISTKYYRNAKCVDKGVIDG